MLSYQSFLPSRRLSDFIARYIIINDTERHQEWQRVEVTPTGLSGLGFSLADDSNYHSITGNQQQITRGSIAGLHNCSFSVSWKRPMNIFFMIFKPTGAFRLLKANMNELRNDLINLDELGLKESEWICEHLRSCSDHRDMIAFMEKWLVRKLADDGLGATPKEFAGIVRFNYLNALLRRQSISLSELVYLGNFHDQSHLNKHFQQLTGLTPHAFKNRIADERSEVRFVNQHNVHGLITRGGTISAAAR